MKSPITTHILNTTLGKPAAGVTVILERREASDMWKEFARGVTNTDGRVMDLLPEVPVLASGVFRMIFLTGDYFAAMKTDCFYPKVTIEFNLKAGEHYHIPLLLNPFGYSTYRGS